MAQPSPREAVHGASHSGKAAPPRAGAESMLWAPGKTNTPPPTPPGASAQAEDTWPVGTWARYQVDLPYSQTASFAVNSGLFHWDPLHKP